MLDMRLRLNSSKWRSLSSKASIGIEKASSSRVDTLQRKHLDQSI